MQTSFPNYATAKSRASDINNIAKQARKAIAEKKGDNLGAAERSAKVGRHTTNGVERFVVHITGGPEGAVTES